MYKNVTTIKVNGISTGKSESIAIYDRFGWVYDLHVPENDIDPNMRSIKNQTYGAIVDYHFDCGLLTDQFFLKRSGKLKVTSISKFDIPSSIF